MTSSWSRPWSRRASAADGPGTAVAPGPGTARALTTPDGFAPPRARWRGLILGEGFGRAAEPFRCPGAFGRVHRRALHVRAGRPRVLGHRP
ncbi:hypothetical protein ACH4JS_06815 [Streptomyces sp. NPDC017638]|uniref:hypothetical protein n=1 Tax=Streptomyces sp. NPDC017638 TaxID=3365004 RepID=UPI0037B0342C